MPRLKYLDAAKQDLLDIARYIADESGSAEIARAFTQRLRAQCRMMVDLPASQLGTDRSELLPGIRSIPYGNYVIFFRYNTSAVEIINILEGHRDIEAFFRR